MDPRFQTSFIPKKPIVSAPGRAPSTISLFSLLGTTLFIVAVALSGGVFFYKGLIAKQIENNKVTLERAKGAFEPELINQIIRLDTRLEVGKKLLTSHLAVTPFFDFLSTVTLKSVRFRDFNFTYLAPDKILVNMKGQAESYAAVALQSDLLNAQKKLKDTILQDMTLDQSGSVFFNLSTILDSSLVSYGSTLAPAAFEIPASNNSTGTSTTQTP